jgi:hypothetical protein
MRQLRKILPAPAEQSVTRQGRGSAEATGREKRAPMFTGKRIDKENHWC